jgi:ribosomal protein L32
VRARVAGTYLVGMTAPSVSICPSCGVSATGRFCAECGTAIGGATCAECRATLTPGAKFCHRCGTPVGERGRRAAGERGLAGALPWTVAAIALLALVALVAGQRIARTRPPATPAVAGDEAGVQSGALGDASRAPVAAPDISNLTPEQAAERLFNRIMTSFEARDTARVQFFAPMAVQAYQRLPRLTLDERYHLGRIGAVTGVAQLTTAQADTMLRIQPTHLLGLVLAAQGARMRGDESAARAFEKRLLAAQAAELKKQLPEYAQHANDIARAIDVAKSRGG